MPPDAGLDVFVPSQPTAADRERLPRTWRPTRGEVAVALLALAMVLIAVGACASVLTVWVRG